MIKKASFVAISALTAVFFFGGCFLKKKPEAVSGEVIKIRVEVDTIKKRDLEERRLFTGVLEPMKKADLAPASQGALVREMRVEVGAFVRKGQVLARMDDAQLATLKANFVPVQASYERNKRLLENNAVSKAQFDQIEAQYNAMKRQLAQVEDNTIIRAPFAGVITGRNIEEGELYSPGMGAMGGSSGMLRLTVMDPLKIDIDLDENAVVHVKKGMPVDVAIEALDTTLRGEIEWVNPSADRRSHTFVVRVKLPNKDKLLRPGFFAKVFILTEKREQVVSAPAGALVGDRLFTVENDSIAVARMIETGWKAGDYVEILSGVEEGALVVTKGNKALPDSSLISIAGMDEKAR